jgi:putative tricarboxylic transport membrane protein
MFDSQLMSTRARRRSRWMPTGLFLAVAAMVAAVVGFGAGAASAADFPTKPVTIIVAFSAGSNPDLEARQIAGPLGSALGQTVVVKDLGGGAQVKGINALQNAPADGYTLLVVSGSVEFTLANGLTNYKPDDFAFVRNLADQATGVYVKADSPFKSVDDIVTYAKAHPGELNASASGAVSRGNQVVQKIAAANGVEFTYVPQNGGGEVAAAVLGGHVDFGVTSLANVLRYTEAGKTRVLTVAQDDPYPFLPDVPSWSKFGVKGESRNWVGVIAKAGMPSDVADTLIDAFNTAVKDSAWLEFLKKSGATPAVDAGDAFASRFDAELAVVQDYVDSTKN